MKTELFVKATKMHLRYPFRGSISTEQLWDLGLEDLDGIYKELKGSQKLAAESSLLNTTRPEDVRINLAIEVVEFVFNSKSEDSKNSLKVLEKRRQRQYLLNLLNEKQDEETRSKSTEELQRMIDALDSEETDTEE